ncbi:unnamed protein product [Mycena citricolor]|uniref:Alpha-type protein kinase domain-containing protein n=1 Tax=Mycena citricolor TaxID=2018698 RepID=A0AAD2K4R2_9AGAR|nr:unnamed protein product [Mycena citricolor]
MLCTKCATTFPLLEGSDVCNLCLKITPGMTETEERIVRDQKHCKGCSMVFTHLLQPLCQKCLMTLVSAESIPRTILFIEGAAAQIHALQTAVDSAADLLQIAVQHKNVASEPRLGILPRTGMNANLLRTPNAAAAVACTTTMSTSSQSSTARSTTLQAQRDRGRAITIVVGLATSFSQDPSKTAKAISSVRLLVEVGPKTPTFNAFAKCLDQVNSALASTDTFPNALHITRDKVAFFFVESATKYFMISTKEISELTIEELIAQYSALLQVGIKSRDTKRCEIKLVVPDTLIYGEHGYKGTRSSDKRSLVSSTKVSKAKTRSASAATGSSTAGAAQASTSATGGSSAVSAASGKRISLWPTSHFLRLVSPDVGFIKYRFRAYRIELDGMAVRFQRPDPNGPLGTILVMADWKRGSQLEQIGDKDYLKTGFLGRGSSKHGIYARINGKEYSLNQSFHEDGAMTEVDNRNILMDELRNTQRGYLLLQQFHELLAEKKVRAPRFAFNHEGSLIGELLPLEDASRLQDKLPFSNFLATPYLPVGTAEAKIEKFTGGWDCGSPPNDRLTAIIHAFTHWMIVYTGKQFVLTDLQGMYDEHNVMKLMDPQSHSSEIDRDKRPFWDLGPTAVEHVLDHHLESCDSNDFCVRLGLKTIEYGGEQEAKEDTGGRGRALSVTLSPRANRHTKKPRHASSDDSSDEDQSPAPKETRRRGPMSLGNLLTS